MQKYNYYYNYNYNHNYNYKKTRYKKPKQFRFTHYFCLPLDNNEFRAEYIKFRDEVNGMNIPGISPFLFQRDDKLHLTLFLISADDWKIAKIVQVLISLHEEIKKIVVNKPLKYCFEKFEILGNCYEQTRVVYGKPKEDENIEKINKINNLIIQELISQNLISYTEIEKCHLSYDEVNNSYKNLLHLTLLNSTFTRKRDDHEGCFDSSKLFEVISKSVYLTECNLNSIYLCKLATENGAPYNVVHQINLN
jgi:hypothetical protein